MEIKTNIQQMIDDESEIRKQFKLWQDHPFYVGKSDFVITCLKSRRNYINHAMEIN